MLSKKNKIVKKGSVFFMGLALTVAFTSCSGTKEMTTKERLGQTVSRMKSKLNKDFKQSRTNVQYIVSNGSSNQRRIKTKLMKVEPGVEVKALIFQNKRLEVDTLTNEFGEIEVTALYQSGIPAIQGMEQERVEAPDQIIYTKDGEEHSSPIKKVYYLPTKVAKP